MATNIGPISPSGPILPNDGFVWNLDCIQGMHDHVEACSVGHLVTSIPFGALFTYSGKIEDIGNNPDGGDMVASQFGLHIRFFCNQLYRVMQHGRIVGIHIQQLRATIVQHGYMGRRDLRSAVIDLFSAEGFVWTGEVAIPKNPQIMAKRQNLHSLQFETGIMRDACALAPAPNDYVMFFRKPDGPTAVPVRCIYDRKRNPGGWITTEDWIKWASGCWDDILETDVLSGLVKEEGDEKHVCPLQLEVPRRTILLYSNPGDVVLDPFMGIGTTGVVTRQTGRVSLGFELKESYHAQAVRNIADAVKTGTSLDFGESVPA